MVVDRRKILENASKFKALIGDSLLCAVVKANAYGHGAIEVASYIDKKVDMFAVATVDEAVSLRIGGINKDILVLTPPLDASDVERGINFGVIFSVGDEKSLCLLLGAEKEARAHVAVNTGMNRYGFSPHGLNRAAERFLCTNVRIEGIYSHLYLCDDEAESARQLALFKECAEYIQERAGKMLIKHIAATGGALRGKEYYLDMVRVGLGLYGYLPFASDRIETERAMKVYAPVSARADFVPGGCGYRRGRGKSTLRFGYADGLSRALFSERGALCMDALVSEEGERGDFLLVFDDADEAAKKLNTISYEILCSFSERTERRYEQ